MTKIVGVKFPYILKAAEFDAGDINVELHQYIVVESAQGMELGAPARLDPLPARDLDLEHRLEGRGARRQEGGEGEKGGAEDEGMGKRERGRGKGD